MGELSFLLGCDTVSYPRRTDTILKMIHCAKKLVHDIKNSVDLTEGHDLFQNFCGIVYMLYNMMANILVQCEWLGDSGLVCLIKNNQFIEACSITRNVFSKFV